MTTQKTIETEIRAVLASVPVEYSIYSGVVHVCNHIYPCTYAGVMDLQNDINKAVLNH